MTTKVVIKNQPADLVSLAEIKVGEGFRFTPNGDVCYKLPISYDLGSHLRSHNIHLYIEDGVSHVISGNGNMKVYPVGPASINLRWGQDD